MIEQLLANARAEGLLTHASIVCGSLDRVDPDYAYDHLPGKRDIFDLASLTKALVTTPLVFDLIASNRITLATTIGEWLGPKACDLSSKLQQLKVSELLRHETGLPAWRNLWTEPQDPDREARLVTMLNRVASHQGDRTKSVYSDVGFLLLGLALTRSAGKNLSVQFEALSQAAGPTALRYGNPDVSRAVPTSYCAVRGRQLLGEVHDENCWALGGITAHAGLFGTARDVARYLVDLVKSRHGKALVDSNAAQVKAPPNEPLMGWRQGADPSSETFGEGRSMGHMGFPGVAFWVCPTTRAYAIFLSNRVIGGRTRPGIAALRRAVFSELNLLRAR